MSNSMKLPRRSGSSMGTTHLCDAACLPQPLFSGLRQRRRQSVGTGRRSRGGHSSPVWQGPREKTEGGRAGQYPPLCAAGAARYTPSSSPTPAPPAGKLEDTSHPPLQVTACSGLACWGWRAADKPKPSALSPGAASPAAAALGTRAGGLREGRGGDLHGPQSAGSSQVREEPTGMLSCVECGQEVSGWFMDRG